jgi:hypothetical protein
MKTTSFARSRYLIGPTMSNKDDELTKPSIEVVTDDDVEKSRDQWKEAAFRQARKGLKLRQDVSNIKIKIDVLSKRLDEALKAYENDEDA